MGHSSRNPDTVFTNNEIENLVDKCAENISKMYNVPIKQFLKASSDQIQRNASGISNIEIDLPERPSKVVSPQKHIPYRYCELFITAALRNF